MGTGSFSDYPARSGCVTVRLHRDDTLHWLDRKHRRAPCLTVRETAKVMRATSSKPSIEVATEERTLGQIAERGCRRIE